jgi:transcriptional regulator with PAS, ATPase and Fis domain
MNAVIETNSQELTELDTDCTSAQDFSRAPQAFLILQTENRSDILKIPTDGEATVGRGEESTLALDDGRISRTHARFFWKDGNLTVEDLKSRNGTYVNGIRLPDDQLTHTLKAADRLVLGSHEFLVALVAEGGDQSPPPQAPADSSNEAPLAAGIVVADAKMTRTYGFAHRIAAANTTALVLGETGSGKEVLVAQIHKWSRRSKGPLIRVNCAALPESLVESELFGHEKGAFTGATQRKIGFAEAANGGTLFLDELGELPAPAQAKLLTMLENRSITRVGSTKEVPLDIRVIAATHRDLQEEVAHGRFREDLYYRIGVVILRVPPLRERRAEIPLLAELFARKFAKDSGLPDVEKHFSDDALEILRNHSFPGNIRELRNAIEHALLVSGSEIVEREHLPETLISAKKPARTSGAEGVSIKEQVAVLERQSIIEALKAKGGNRTHSALELGISLRSLLYKIKKYQITD